MNFVVLFEEFGKYLLDSNSKPVVYITKSLPIIDIFNNYVYLNISTKTYLNGILIDFKNKREIISSGSLEFKYVKDSIDFNNKQLKFTVTYVDDRTGETVNGDTQYIAQFTTNTTKYSNGKCSGTIDECEYYGKTLNIQPIEYTDILPDVLGLETTTIATTNRIETVDEHSNYWDTRYVTNYYCINENGIHLLDDVLEGFNIEKTGSITQTLTVANHANDYNFHTVIKDVDGNTLVDTNSMNITERLGGVSLKQAASMLLNNTDNAKNKVYIGDYFELGGYTWQNKSGTTFTAGTAKYTLVERTSSGNLIFMSSERHKLTSEGYNALTWENLITNNKLETILLPQLESILGITPVSYTRKSDIPHLTNKRVFLPTEYEIFGTYNYQKENERYEGERQWEAFNFNKEANRKIFRRDVITGNINNYAPSNDDNGYGYWLATSSSLSDGASNVGSSDNSRFGGTTYNDVTNRYIGVRPCFML